MYRCTLYDVELAATTTVVVYTVEYGRNSYSAMTERIAAHHTKQKVEKHPQKSRNGECARPTAQLCEVDSHSCRINPGRLRY